MPRPRQFKQGEAGEGYVEDLLSSAGISFEKSQGRFSEWDYKIIAQERDICLEVKYDLLEARTGNIAIEYHNNRVNKPSGILATSSDIWVVVLGNPPSAWMANTQDVLEYFENGSHLKDIKGGDGGYAASLRLFKSAEILKIFQPMEVSPWELFSNLLFLAEKSYTQCESKLS